MFVINGENIRRLYDVLPTIQRQKSTGINLLGDPVVSKYYYQEVRLSSHLQSDWTCLCNRHWKIDDVEPFQDLE